MAGKPSSQLTSQTISKSMPSNKKKAQKSSPKDTICCVCSSTTETGHMVECECCSSWCHSKCMCIGISISLTLTYPFICPFCVKQTTLEINKLRVTLSNVQAGLSDLEEKFNKDLPPAVKSDLQEISESLSSSDLPKASTDNIQMLPCPATIYKCLLVCHHGQK